MLGSYKIGSVLGITVRVHWLFLALIAFFVLMPGEDLSQTLTKQELMLSMALLFGMVFLHELGHSLVARRFGIRVYDITFWPLGGMARMSEIPESPRVEMLIAVAGPAVNFVLAALAAPVALWSFMARGEAPESSVLATVFSLSMTLVFINLMLGIFNLVPAFPMDGGRVLRAFLARNRDWVKATEQAVKVGRGFAIAMIAFGLLFSSRGLMFLPLIGLFVWFAGARELWAVRLRHGRMPFGPLAGQPVAPLRPEGPAWTNGAAAPGARVPQPATSTVAPGRLSEADIERLERFGGPLRQFRSDE